VLLVEIHVGEGKLLDRTCRRRRAPGRNRWGGERVQAAATDFGRGRASCTTGLGAGSSPRPGCVSGPKKEGREGREVLDSATEEGMGR
jgi:hypothetical protein